MVCYSTHCEQSLKGLRSLCKGYQCILTDGAVGPVAVEGGHGHHG